MSWRMLPACRFAMGSMLLLSIASSAGIAAAVTPVNASCELTDSNADSIFEIAGQADLLDFKADFADCTDEHLLQTANFVVDDATATNFGDLAAPFAGTYDGGGHTITFHDLASASGLFGYTDGATIRNLHLAASGTTALGMGKGWFAYQLMDSTLVGVSSSGDMTAAATAGIAFEAIGNTTITNSYTTGDIDGFISGGFFHATDDNTTIINSYTTGDINSDNSGGFIAIANDNTTIINSYTTGDMNNQYASGMIFESNDNATITNSYTTGRITGTIAAGLVADAYDNTTIINSYTTGDVEGFAAAGLVARANNSTTITNTYTTGDVTGQFAAGLVIEANDSPTITNSYTTGNVVGDFAAGLVEEVNGSATIAHVYAAGNVTGDQAVGLVYGNRTGIDLSTAFHDPDGQWSTADANNYLTGVPSSIPGLGAVWGACTDDTPFFLVVFADANVCPTSSEEDPKRRRRPALRTVTIDPAGGTCSGNSSPWTVTQRRSVTLPTDCTRDGHTLLGWTRNPANTTPEYLIHDVMPRSGTVTAVWAKLPAAPTNVIALRDFLCDTCGTALVIWQNTDTDTTTFTVTIDDTPTICTPVKLDDWWLCDVSDLTPNQPHTFGVTAQNSNGTSTTTTTR